LETTTFNRILNIVINPQTSKVKPSKPTLHKIVINKFTANFLDSKIFVMLFTLLVWFLFDKFTSILVIFYLSIIFVFKQFYYSTKTFSGFSHFLISIFSKKKTKNKSLNLNKLIISDDKSINFDLMKLSLIPLCYFIILERVTHVDYQTPNNWVTDFFGESTNIWMIGFGMSICWMYNVMVLLYSSGKFSLTDESTSSDNLNVTINLEHQSHPTNILNNFYDKTSRVINCCLYLGVVFGFYFLNRTFPEWVLFIMIGVSLFIFHKIIKYKQEFNHRFLYRNIKSQSKFKSKGGFNKKSIRCNSVDTPNS
jgi:hypothetical protein